jgi:hypothetical protein
MVFRLIGLIMVLALLGSQHALAGQCERANKGKIREIDQQIKALQKEAPKELRGKQVASGECVRTALKLGIIFGLKKDYQNQQAWSEAMACLELEKFALRESCRCEQKGWVFSDQPADTKAVMDSRWKEIKAVETRLRSAGIRNPAIREYVREASSARDCISEMAVQELDEALAALNDLKPEEEEEAADDATSEIDDYRNRLRKFVNRTPEEKKRERDRLKRGDLTPEEQEVSAMLARERKEFLAESARLAREAEAARRERRRVDSQQIGAFLNELLRFGALAAQGWNIAQQFDTGTGTVSSSGGDMCSIIRANLRTCESRRQRTAGDLVVDSASFADCVRIYRNAGTAAGC